MPIAILLRRTYSINRFRDILIKSIDSGLGHSAIICSGFFQQNKKYQATSEPKFIAACAKLKELQTIGVYNGLWLNDYREFVRSLRKCGVNIQAYRNRGLRWHAKVFVLSNKKKPILAIIGSSNITRSAFSVTSPFNWECDAIIWSSKPKSVAQQIRNIILDDLTIGFDVIIAEYNAKQNNSITIDQRLKQLVTELNEMKNEILE